ncbi:MAG TPA: molybdopterin-dependent oxidoreductase [Acidimicrobiales bacterium]|nr:molybdopterin-dependent oxidoreductase [Acidimicrobiales bacterium]
MDLTRRTFLKGTAAGGGALAATGAVGAGFGPASTRTGPRAADDASVALEEVVTDAVCSPNCWMGCRISAHVRDGRLVKTSMNPFPEPRYNRICLRGLSHVQWLYNPDRLLKPLKRAGKRGEGRWEEISWDQALDEIATKIADIRTKHGPKAFAVVPGSGNYGAVNGGFGYAIQVFANELEATMGQLAVDQATPLGMSQVLANMVGGAAGMMIGNEAVDMANADLIVAWGTNMTESQVHNWHFVADARDLGATLVVIDPNFSILASKADKWIAPRPGSDPALGLSLIATIVEEKLYDKAFLLQHTVAPFLVRSSDGMFARVDQSNPMSEALVWDNQAGAAVPLSAASDPAIEGTFDIGGVTVRPAFALLAERVAAFAPEKARKYTDLDPEDVRWLARTYARTRKSFVYPGFGIDRWENGYQTGRTIGTLAALTGNIGESGATPAGAMGGGALGLLLDPRIAGPLFSPSGKHAAPLTTWHIIESITGDGTTTMLAPVDPADPTKGIASPEPIEVQWPIKGLYFHSLNIANLQDTKRFIEEGLVDESKVELIVTADSLMTDSARYSDYVLPVTHWLENDDLVGGIHPYLARNVAAVEPLGEARSDYHIFKALAERLGFGQFYEGEPKDLVTKLIGALAMAVGAMGSDPAKVLADFERDGAVRLLPGPYVGFADKVFWTASGRAEFYAERVIANYPPGAWIPVSMGADPLPDWVPPTEGWHENPSAETYPLVYMQEHSRWRVHTTFHNQPWLREVNPEPYVDINTKDAAARGIAAGDMVEIFNDRGATQARARVSGRMRPGMVSLPKGWQRRQTRDDSGFSDLTPNYKHKLSNNGSYFDVLVDVRKAES